MDARLDRTSRRLGFVRSILSTPSNIAMARIRSLNADPLWTQLFDEQCSGLDTSQGIAYLVVSLLTEATEIWDLSIRSQASTAISTVSTSTNDLPEEEKKESSDASPKNYPHKRFLIHGTKQTSILMDALLLHLAIAKLDMTLAEELGKSGSHMILSRLVQFEFTSIHLSTHQNSFEPTEEDQDAVMEIQDIACEIGSLCGGSFPMKFSPFTEEELRHRLPLSFVVTSAPGFAIHLLEKPCVFDSIPEQLSILIHQVTERQGAQDDVGFVLWPSAVVLSAWLMSNPEFLMNKTVMELGAGCGLVGLVAARIVAESKKTITTATAAEIQAPSSSSVSKVLITDFNSVVLRNIERNIVLNDLNESASIATLDFFAQSGNNVEGGWMDDGGNDNEPVDIILAADVICKPEDAEAFANTVHDALCPGGMAIVVSAHSKHRFGVDRLVDECHRVGLKINVSNVVDSLESGLESIHGIDQTAGFCEDMEMNLFRIIKPISFNL